MNDGPITEALRAQMNALAHSIDEFFNGKAKGKDRKIAFVLLVSEFDQITDGRVNYISNGDRQDVTVLLKEILARFEGQPNIKGTA